MCIGIGIGICILLLVLAIIIGMAMFLLSQMWMVIASMTASCCVEELEEEEVERRISTIIFGVKNSARRALIEKKEVDYLAQYFCMTTNDDMNDFCDNSTRNSKSTDTDTNTNSNSACAPPQGNTCNTTQRIVHQFFIGGLYR